MRLLIVDGAWSRFGGASTVVPALWKSLRVKIPRTTKKSISGD